MKVSVDYSIRATKSQGSKKIERVRLVSYFEWKVPKHQCCRPYGTPRYDTEPSRDGRHSAPTLAPPFASPFPSSSISQSLDVTRVGRSSLCSQRLRFTRPTGSHSLRTNIVSRSQWVLCCDQLQCCGYIVLRDLTTCGSFEVYGMRAWAQRMTCYETLRAPAPAANAPMAHHFVKWWRNKFRNGYKKFSSKL